MAATNIISPCAEYRFKTAMVNSTQRNMEDVQVFAHSAVIIELSACLRELWDPSKRTLAKRALRTRLVSLWSRPHVSIFI